jgi:putative glutamine amidotransferase
MAPALVGEDMIPRAEPWRPIIGVTGPDRRGWALRGFTYFAVRRAGGRPLAITPRRIPHPDRLDGVVVAGGADVDPALYGQTDTACRRLDPPRDRLEADLLRWAVEHGRPVLGICRGMQLLNVALGGTLHQDASKEYPGFTPTSGLYRQITLRRPVHVIKRGWVSAQLGTGRKVHLVNSLHRQAIAEVAPDLEVVAVDEQGMIQAVELAKKDVFAVGLQWHPELMPHSAVQMSFFRALVAACRGAAIPDV